MKRLLSFSILFLAMSITTLAQAQTQTTAVVPGPVTPNLRGEFADFTTTEGNNLGDSNALGRFNNTVFSIYDESLVLAAGINPGDQLTGLAFRVGGNNVVPNFTVENYIIDLGHALSSIQANVNLNDNFNANAVGGALTNVHTGRVDFNAADYPNPNTSTIAGTANPFGPSIEFDTNFTYEGGDLLLRYTHTLPEALDGSLVTSRADSISSTFGVPDFGDDRVQTFFGAGFDATDRGFETRFGEFSATIVQFDIAAIPEPSSAALLMGLGMIGVVRRRRKI